ncbi:B12-binding domain-containing radical SAM protein [Candidatus Peregrinibacteria bacterium]|nr:B12-binding domain-containing radical SAM protein [Candidatus Peregrinibacteria bacterium]
MRQQNEHAEFQRAPDTSECREECANSRIVVNENRKRMRILMVEPKTPSTYWSYDYTMPLIGKKSAHTPLGILTVAGMLPKEWEVDMADLNTGKLSEAQLQKADAVFIGGMHIQAQSFHELVERAKKAKKEVVGGGPYVTSSPEECQDLDHLVIGEVEEGIDVWCQEFEQGKADHITEMPRPKNLNRTNIARYDLINPRDYFSMNVQMSRGCPHNCEFCSVTKLNGRNPRLKSPEQLVAELETIRSTGFRGSTFIVDDNFIGNYREVQAALPAIIDWQRQHGYPLDLFTQTSMKLAEHEDLMAQMVEAGVSGVFLGIETPSKKALEKARKHHNARMDLDEGVRKIARAGLEPMAGFIMGLDGDDAEDLDEIGRFINRNPIPSAMVGLPQAIPQTDMYARMKREGRLLSAYNGDLQGYSGDQFEGANFQTEIDPTILREKYAQVLTDIYDPGNYFRRCLHFMRIRGQSPKYSLLRHRLTFGLNALKNSIYQQGIIAEYRAEYWKFLSRVATEMTSKLQSAVTHAAKLHHYYTYTYQNVLPRFAET